MQSRPAKYLFDEDFAAAKAADRSRMADHERQAAEAEPQAYRQGFAAAKAAGRTGPTERSRRTSRDRDALDWIERGLTALERTLETEAVEVAVAMAAKLAPALIARSRSPKSRHRDRML